jgi:hypothetical protein
VLGVLHGVHATGGRCARGGANVGLACYRGRPYGRALASIADGRGCWTSTLPKTGPHLNGAGPGVEVEGPRGVAIIAVRGSGGCVTAGTTTAAMATITVGSTVVVPPLSTLRVS